MICWTGMNAAVRAIVRMGIYVGCKVYLIKEVCVVLLCLLCRLKWLACVK